jgi:hypothetical protein
MDSFNSFNISFIPREKNKKADSLAVAASLFNSNDSQSQSTFHVKRIFWPSILDNQEYLQVFENDDHVANLLTDNDSMSLNDSKESQDPQKEIQDQNLVLTPKNYVSLESLFTRDDQTKILDLKEEPFVRRFKRHKISTLVLPILQST